MSHKVLIANRGEIALRALRACKELGIQTVSIYSEGDRNLKSLRFSDESVCIGPSDSKSSYLNVPAILSAADLTNADAIYPGYGFLAEDHAFAEQCSLSGFKFIGPHHETIKKMGDKITAKSIVTNYGIKCVPGFSDEIPEEKDELEKITKSIGYPIILKATAGGGGKGMKIVESIDQLSNALQIARKEAEANFGNGRIYIEKFIENPRHIEIQVVGDGKGNAIHLGTRDCSIQRRHQKLIEEAPAMDVNQTKLDELLNCCVELCKDIKYEGAGTLEFLYENEEFYFLEMNTRIQVEHPVTEMVTGFDIVKAQLRIALGLPLSLDQERIFIRGHAIECRINAEDSEKFIPNPGKITRMHIPGGFGIRYDSHIYNGYTVPPFYDSMLAKIITLADSRDSAISRMLMALDEFFIEGIKTTHQFHQKMLVDKTFTSNKHSINYLEKEFLKDGD